MTRLAQDEPTLRQHAARQLEYREGRILDIDRVRIAGLVAALGQRRDVAARHGFDLTEQAIENVAPMREQIEDQPAAGGLAIIPARPLRRVGRAVEHPPAEVEPDRQDSAEEIRLIQLAQLGQPGQEQLVLYDTVFEAGALGAARQVQGIRQCFGERLFDIDVLAGVERRCGACRPAACRARIEIDRDLAGCETGVAIGAPFEAAIGFCQSREFCRIAPEQYWFGHEAVAIGKWQPALIPDRHQRAQMLRRAEPAGRAVYNDADRAFAHGSEPKMAVPLFPAGTLGYAGRGARYGLQRSGHDVAVDADAIECCVAGIADLNVGRGLRIGSRANCVLAVVDDCQLDVALALQRVDKRRDRAVADTLDPPFLAIDYDRRRDAAALRRARLGKNAVIGQLDPVTPQVYLLEQRPDTSARDFLSGSVCHFLHALAELDL